MVYEGWTVRGRMSSMGKKICLFNVKIQKEPELLQGVTTVIIDGGSEGRTNKCDLQI